MIYSDLFEILRKGGREPRVRTQRGPRGPKKQAVDFQSVVLR